MRVGILQNISTFQPNSRYKLKKIRGIYNGTPILIEKAYVDDKLVCKQRYVIKDDKLLLDKTEMYKGEKK